MQTNSLSREVHAELRGYSNDTLKQKTAINPSSLEHFNETNDSTIKIEYKNKII